MNRSFNTPEINAGSMADIAFLLLIFFLVTTTMGADKGIQRKLPPVSEEPLSGPSHSRDILPILVNSNDRILVKSDYTNIESIREIVISFVNNNADQSCSYCENGRQDPSSSANPQKAIISIQNDRETSYKMYLSIQNEVTAAYNILRNRLSQSLYQLNFKELKQPFKIDKIKKAYPINISESDMIVVYH